MPPGASVLCRNEEGHWRKASTALQLCCRREYEMVGKRQGWRRGEQAGGSEHGEPTRWEGRTLTIVPRSAWGRRRTHPRPAPASSARRPPAYIRASASARASARTTMCLFARVCARVRVCVWALARALVVVAVPVVGRRDRVARAKLERAVRLIALGLARACGVRAMHTARCRLARPPT